MIEISNLTQIAIDKKALKRLGKQVLAKEGVQGEVEVSVALVGEKEIQRLNKVYRNKNKPTDILSFGVFGENQNFILPPLKKKQVGELVICPSQIRGKKQEGVEEVFVHGLLHLLGYTHQKEKGAAVMREKEKRYLSQFREIRETNN